MPPGSFSVGWKSFPCLGNTPFSCRALPLFSNDEGVLAVCTGGGINATATIMALGQDPRFDLSKAYWLRAGIAGGDPEDTSNGSAVWAEHVVDGDLLYEIDARDPGRLALGANAPERKGPGEEA